MGLPTLTGNGHLIVRKIGGRRFPTLGRGVLLIDAGTEARATSATMRAQPDLDAKQIGGDLQHCRRCDLWKHASQAVPGEGAARARIMLVGEQPGDEEDLRGHPFVGPAGRMLDQCLNGAALERNEVFVTNAVKHFKWEPRGKRRLHKKPSLREIGACNMWLNSEISRVRPHVVVALGATALRALLGRTWTIDAARRQSLRHSSGVKVLASYHPSAILRAQGEHAALLRATLIEDLTRARVLGQATPNVPEAPSVQAQ
jgi:uracil-DNA glycosylase family protein